MLIRAHAALLVDSNRRLVKLTHYASVYSRTRFLAGPERQVAVNLPLGPGIRPAGLPVNGHEHALIGTYLSGRAVVRAEWRSQQALTRASHLLLSSARTHADTHAQRRPCAWGLPTKCYRSIVRVHGSATRA